MEGAENVRHMSLKEAASIDANKVAFYTLLDGTVVRVKNEGENESGKGAQFQDGENMAIQENKSKNILNAGENYGYYMSKEGVNISQPQEQLQQCTCGHQLPRGYLNYNAKLINAQILYNQNLTQFKSLSSSIQTFQQAQGQMKKRKLYKLVEAIPVRLSDIVGKQSINQNTNTQAYFQNKINSYIAETSLNQNIQEEMVVDSQTQNTLNQLNQNSSNFNKETMAQYNQQQQFEQQEFKENVYQGEGVMNGNQQQIEYCTCDDENENEVRCTCPIGNQGMRNGFEVVSSEYVQRVTNSK